MRSRVEEAKRPIIYEIVAGVIRWKLYLDWLLSHHVRKKVKKRIEVLLKITLYQIEFMRKSPYHVVDEAVSFAKERWGREVGGFVNGVLRNHIRVRERLVPPNLSIKYSFPEWLVRRWERRFGDETESLLSHLNSSPVFGIRVNQDKITVEEVVSYLKGKGICVEKGRYLDYALNARKIMPILKDELFKKGLVRIQDEASQLVVEALRLDGNGKLVLDACCGYGTKTIHILERYGSDTRVIAIDHAKEKVKKVSPLAYRIAGDLLNVPLKSGIFDLVLLDAPCSSLGIIRKHPEIKWRISEEDIFRFSELQYSLLKAIWEVLRPGGSVIYSVCSFEPEETFDIIEKMKMGRKVQIEEVPFSEKDGIFISIPHRTKMDGFFIARLRKI